MTPFSITRDHISSGKTARSVSRARSIGDLSSFLPVDTEVTFAHSVRVPKNLQGHHPNGNHGVGWLYVEQPLNIRLAQDSGRKLRLRLVPHQKTMTDSHRFRASCPTPGWCVSDPLARFARVSTSSGGDYVCHKVRV